MTSPVVVIGAGGHAKVVVDLLFDLDHEVVAAVSSKPAEPYRGVPVRVGDESIRECRELASSCFVALGDNQARVRLANQAVQLGFELITLVSPRAIVSPTASIGAGTIVMDGAIVHADAIVGANAIVNTAAVIEHDCRIGDGAHIAPGVRLAGRVAVGTGGFMGAGSVAIPGIVVGDGAVVGAGAVVVRDVPTRAVVYGVPAREAG